MGLEGKQVKVFDMCKCTGFYKKVNDGRFIQLNEDDCTGDLCDINICDDHGLVPIEKDIETAEKTYYQYVKANINKGVIVGFIDLVVKGWLDVNYEDALDVGLGVMPEKFYVSKRPKEVVKCAIVYYANNKKHYVPLHDIITENEYCKAIDDFSCKLHRYFNSCAIFDEFAIDKIAKQLKAGDTE